MKKEIVIFLFLSIFGVLVISIFFYNDQFLSAPREKINIHYKDVRIVPDSNTNILRANVATDSEIEEKLILKESFNINLFDRDYEFNPFSEKIETFGKVIVGKVSDLQDLDDVGFGFFVLDDHGIQSAYIEDTYRLVVYEIIRKEIKDGLDNEYIISRYDLSTQFKEESTYPREIKRGISRSLKNSFKKNE